MPDIFVDQDKEKKPSVTKKAAKKSSKVPLELIPTKHSHFHFFDAYCESPPNIKLTEKLEHEEILLFLRKHFVTNVPWIIKAIIFALLPILAYLLNVLGVLPLSFLP